MYPPPSPLPPRAPRRRRGPKAVRAPLPTGPLGGRPLKALLCSGAHAPTPFQAQALPFMLCGHDMIGIAQPGTGKALAYLLACVPHIEAQQPLANSSNSPIALVLVPGREVAVQIAKEAQNLLQNSQVGNHTGGIFSISLYAGSVLHSRAIHRAHEGTIARAIYALSRHLFNTNRV